MIIRSLITSAIALAAVPAIAQPGVAEAPAQAQAVKVASATPCRTVKLHQTPPGKPNSYILRTRQVGDCSSATALNAARPDGQAVQASE